MQRETRASALVTSAGPHARSTTRRLPTMVGKSVNRSEKCVTTAWCESVKSASEYRAGLIGLVHQLGFGDPLHHGQTIPNCVESTIRPVKPLPSCSAR